MDMKRSMYFEARVSGTAEPFTFHGEVTLGLARLAIWMRHARLGDVTIKVSARPIYHGDPRVAEVQELLSDLPVFIPPEPRGDDTYESYYQTVLDAFVGFNKGEGDSEQFAGMASYLAREYFPQADG